MRYTRYITTILASLVALSCTVDTTIEQTIIGNGGGKGQFQIVGKITRFDDCNVNTRANKTPDEAYVSSMALAVFPIEGGMINDCVSYLRLTGDNMTFTIDRKALISQYGEQYEDDQFALYIFANMDLPATFGELEDKSLEFFLNKYNENVNGIRRPQTGFPMVGSLGDNITAGGDGKTFILMPKQSETGNPEGLPTLDGQPSDYIPIPMQALYAKHSFSIRVESDLTIEDGIEPRFTITNYQIYNIPAGVCVNAELNDEANSKLSDATASVSLSSTAIASSTIDFEFFLPERFLDPDTSAEEFTYPFGANGTDVVGYSNIRPEDKKYAQRYKKELLGSDQKATYIVIQGKYHDHQGHDFDVDYTIHLGADNYQDFNIKRNTHYINTMVIRGVSSSSNQSVNQDGIFIDHRVNVESGLPIIINLQRETKLDSHFEVRPLRIRYPLGDGESVPADAKATISVEPLNEGDDVSWVRLEHNNGGTANDTYCASGKRRYFTTNLVTSTLADKSSIEVPITNGDQQTVWIYVDECALVADTGTNGSSRQARISVKYSDSKGEQPAHNYTLNQYLLYPVTTTRSDDDVAGSTTAAGSYTYYIEHEEEYLHNFDAEDDYGLTDQGGMEWGLNGIQLSHTTEAIAVKATDDNFWEWLLGFIRWDKQEIVDNAVAKLNPKPYYDFYLVRDVDPNAPITPNAFNGYVFNTSIISCLKTTYSAHQTQGNNASYNAKVDKIALDEQPKSAIAYCYNKNKRNAEGVVESIKWYLPAIDEIEDIAEVAYGDFGTQFQDNFYWSSQPSYLAYDATWTISTALSDGTTEAKYYLDNKNRARATKVLKENGEFAGVPNSGDGTFATQTGAINKPAFRDPTITMNTPVDNPNYDATCANYPGNLPRTGQKARIRCVYKP